MISILNVTCGDLAPFLRIIKYIFLIVKYLIPILLIALITYDMIKAFMANDDKQMKDASSKSFKRILYALLIFLVPTLISLLFKLVGTKSLGSDDLGSITDGLRCYNSVSLR